MRDDLSNDAASEESPLTRDDQEYLEKSRHFTREGYQQLYALMARIGEGDAAAKNAFIGMIQPYVDRSATRIAEQVFGDSPIDLHMVEEVGHDIVMHLLAKPQFFQGSEASWNNFGQTIQGRLRSRLESEHHKQQKETRSAETANSKYVTADFGLDPAEVYERDERAAIVDKAIHKLSPRHRAIVEKRTMDGEKIEVVSRELGCSNSHVGASEHRAFRKLRLGLQDLDPSGDYINQQHRIVDHAAKEIRDIFKSQLERLASQVDEPNLARREEKITALQQQATGLNKDQYEALFLGCYLDSDPLFFSHHHSVQVRRDLIRYEDSIIRTLKDAAEKFEHETNTASLGGGYFRIEAAVKRIINVAKSIEQERTGESMSRWN